MHTAFAPLSIALDKKIKGMGGYNAASGLNSRELAQICLFFSLITKI